MNCCEERRGARAEDIVEDAEETQCCPCQECRMKLDD